MRRYIIYIYYIYLGLCVSGCRNSKYTESAMQVTQQVTAISDSCSAEQITQEIIAWVDTSTEEVSCTTTIYDTERLDSSGLHPVKSVSVLVKKKNNAISANSQLNNEEKMSATYSEDVVISDSIATQREKVVTHSSGLKWGIFIGALLVVLLFILGKKLRSYLEHW